MKKERKGKVDFIQKEGKVIIMVEGSLI